METDTSNSRNSMQILQRGLPFVLSVIIPGAGHLLVRKWRRGVAWLGLFIFTLAFLSAYTMDLPHLFIFSVLDATLSPMNIAFPGAILLLCLVDLYLLTRFESETKL